MQLNLDGGEILLPDRDRSVLEYRQVRVLFATLFVRNHRSLVESPLSTANLMLTELISQRRAGYKPLTERRALVFYGHGFLAGTSLVLSATSSQIPKSRNFFAAILTLRGVLYSHLREVLSDEFLHEQTTI